MKSKEVKVWKVLWRRHRCSITLNPDSMDLCLHYPVGEFVKPKIGKIFCFKSKVLAKRFVKDLFGEYSIHQAIAINPVEIKMVCAPFWNSAKEFWTNPSFVDRQTFPAPPGTYVCDALKCLE